MESIHIYLATIEKTEEFGRALGEVTRPAEIICLDGNLGAGKTTLTKMIARGLSVPPEYYVTSPTFNIFHEYPGRIPLYHMDFYRLGNEEDVLAMGLDEYFYQDGLTIIEWAERASEILPEERLTIQLTSTGLHSREAQCHLHQSTWKERLVDIAERLSQ